MILILLNLGPNRTIGDQASFSLNAPPGSSYLWSTRDSTQRKCSFPMYSARIRTESTMFSRWKCYPAISSSFRCTIAGASCSSKALNRKLAGMGDSEMFHCPLECTISGFGPWIAGAICRIMRVRCVWSVRKSPLQNIPIRNCKGGNPKFGTRLCAIVQPTQIRTDPPSNRGTVMEKFSP